MADHFDERNPKASIVMCSRAVVKMEILWKGNTISCIKSFGKKSCKLCMKERMAILNKWEDEPGLLMNSRSEIFGGCRRKTRFHRYIKNRPIEQPSTDDGVNPERVKFGYNGDRAKWWIKTIPLNGVVICPSTGGDPADTADV